MIELSRSGNRRHVKIICMETAECLSAGTDNSKVATSSI